MLNLTGIKYKFLLTLFFIGTFSLEAVSVRRLSEAVKDYNNERYRSSLSEVKDYLKENPADEIAYELKEIIEKKIAFGYLKRGYTYVAEGYKKEASEEFDAAAEYHSELTAEIEGKYLQILESYSEKEAANRMIYSMIKRPVPSDSEYYRVVGSVRSRVAEEEVASLRRDFDILKSHVNDLIDERRWGEAVKNIKGYLEENPESEVGVNFLTEVKRKAAEDYFEQALEKIQSGEDERGRELAGISRDYDERWYTNVLESKIKGVQTKIHMGDYGEAEEIINILKHLAPELDGLESYYVDYVSETPEGFLNNSVRKYEEREYSEAVSRFEFLKGLEPENRDAQLYYHLSSARAYIREQDLENIRLHLIKVLEISPGEKEALEIFERLQDVAEIVNNAY